MTFWKKSNYFLILKITPRATPRNAANSTCRVGGSRKVIVWAGYQNNGMVLAKTKPYWISQLIFFDRVSRIFSGWLKKPFSEPPVSAIWMSVILWKVMNTGAKRVFIKTLTQRATKNLP